MNSVTTKRTIKKVIEAYEQYNPGSVSDKLIFALLGRDITPIKTIAGKYTIIEVEFRWEGYIHHFFGLSVKHPKDKRSEQGEKMALSYAIRDLIEEISERIEKKEQKKINRISQKLDRKIKRRTKYISNQITNMSRDFVSKMLNVKSPEILMVDTDCVLIGEPKC